MFSSTIKRTLLTLSLFSLALVSCGENGKNGQNGKDGKNGASCSFSSNSNGTTTIACPDGSSFTIQNGEKGQKGDAGSDGDNGQNGTYCQLVENIDGSQAIVCPADGSSFIVRGNPDNYINYCKPGFYGKNCENMCPDCGEHGTCNDGINGTGKCDCEEYWIGPTCSEEIICQEGFGGISGKDCNSCLKGYYGELCEPCTCQNGECWDGKSGNGLCKGTCAEGWEGDNCDKCSDGYATENCVLPTCKNGTANLGLTGDGHCSECNGEWSGTDCDIESTCKHGTANLGLTGDGHCSECNGEWSGTDCDIESTCKHGTPRLGLTGDGHCSECNGEWSGTDCDIESTCKHGTPRLGLTGDGHCSKCSAPWTGDDCDICPAGFYHVGDNCFDCRKGATGSAFGTDSCTYTDTRNDETTTYNLVTIGDQLWMAQNMALTPNDKKLRTDYFYPGNNSNNLQDYGYLYTWDTAKSICPPGWHLPSGSSENNENTKNYDFNKLLAYVSNNKSTDTSDFLALIANSPTWKNYSNQGLDEFGFGAMAAGNYYSGSYYNFGNLGRFWSSTESASPNAYYLYLGGDHADVGSLDKTLGYSVRCIRDEG